MPTLAGTAVVGGARSRWFWAAQVVSEAGAGTGSVALPLVAVLSLGASALDMGVLAAGQGAILFSVLVLVVARPDVLGVVLLGLAQVLMTAGLQVFSVNQISLRQAITPAHLLARVNATRRVAVFGMVPIGALLGGWLGVSFGLRAGLVAAGLVQVVALATLVRSTRQTCQVPQASRRS